jgi:hypothetical protein
MPGPGEVSLQPPIERARRRRFVAFHKQDRNFFLAFLGLCWLGVVMGFMPAVAQRQAGHADYPAPVILEIHAVAFSAWMALLTVQIALIRTRRPLLHMRLGMVGLALVPVMAVSAFLSEVYSQRFHFAHPPDSQAFFIIAIYYVLAFTVLATLALAARNNPGAHKRLILLATTIIVGAAYGRWWGHWLYLQFGDGPLGMLINTFAGAELLMLGALAYDWATRGRLHRVYEIAVPAILLGQLATTLIYHSPRWLPIARLAIDH